MTADREKTEILRAEQIKGNFLLYGQTVFALHCCGRFIDGTPTWRGFRAFNNLRKSYEP